MGDDLWLGVKGQANPDIAGSPRNYFGSASRLSAGGRALEGLGGFTALPNLTKTPNTGEIDRGRQTMGAKVHVRKGNSPDRQLRSLSHG